MNYRNVFITGISSGIGKATCTYLLRHGASVFGISRRHPDITHPALKFKNADITDFEATSSVVQSLAEQAGGFDLVILNAGVLGPIADMADQDMEEMKAIMNTNLWANKPLLDAVFKVAPSPKQVVAISSGAAVNGNRGWGGYALSKAALNMFIQLYAAERPETHFTALAPGLVDTAMQEYLCTLPADERFSSVENIAAKRGSQWMPTPEEMAERLVSVMEKLPGLTESGGFIDVRKTEGWMPS